MDIFGVSLSETQLWLLTIVGGLGSIFLAFRLLIVRSYYQEMSATKDRFRDAFRDASLNLKEHGTHSIVVVTTYYGQHLAAIDKFRPSVTRFRKRKFDLAVENYKQCCAQCKSAGPLSIGVSETTGIGLENRHNLISAMDKLCEFAT